MRELPQISEFKLLKNRFKTRLKNLGIDTTGIEFRDYPNTLKDVELKTNGKYTCRLYDWDGTILKEEHLDSGEYFVLPEMVGIKGYSCTTDIVEHKVLVKNNDIAVGVLYDTAIGGSLFHITLNPTTGLTFNIDMDGAKDWGDGAFNDEKTHTYVNYGDYVIHCDGTTMASLGNSGIFGQSSSYIDYMCTKVELGELVTSIPPYAFANCKSLECISIPQTVTTIGSYAFANDSNLRHVTIPNQVTRIEDETFNGCWSRVSIVLPKGLTYLGKYGLGSNYAMKEVVLPDGLDSFGQYVMYNCSGIEKIIFPDSVEVTGITMNFRNYSLKEVVFSPNTKTIASNNFQYCSAIERLDMPKSVEEISSNAFSSCISLLTINFSEHEFVPALSSTSPFASTNKILKIIVPDKLYDQWVTATNWSKVGNMIYKASEVNL